MINKKSCQRKRCLCGLPLTPPPSSPLLATPHPTPLPRSGITAPSHLFATFLLLNCHFDTRRFRSLFSCHAIPEGKETCRLVRAEILQICRQAITLMRLCAPLSCFVSKLYRNIYIYIYIRCNGLMPFNGHDNDNDGSY
jgi:hypothetical protein